MPVSAMFPRRVISLLVAVALLFAPLWPAAASMTVAKDSAHAMHAMATDAGAGMQHSGHDMAGNSCEQHDACNQICCAACAQCTSAALLPFSRFTLTHAIQSPTVPRLHDRLTVAPRLRPPAA